MPASMPTPLDFMQMLSKVSKYDTIEVDQTDLRTTITVTKTKQQILEEKYGDLVGQPITLTEAAEKYGVPRDTISKWNYRADYIAPLDPDAYPAQFDEAEIAYLCDIYKQRKAQRSRAPLLDDDGLPYQIKDPERAAKVRKQRRKARDT